MTIARLIAGREQTIVHCQPWETVRDAAARLAEQRIGAMPVVDGKAVAGIFSERDLLHCIARHGGDALDIPVGEVMTAPPIAVDPSTPALEALELMTRRRIRHLPVLDGGTMVGFVSIGDLVKYRIDMIEHEAQAMREYIRTA
ncbi:MAG: CBS domain-containing protein [Altererythrobacter sp.]|nr:CBS domain-containing protein [Altererythrobacter sp.]